MLSGIAPPRRCNVLRWGEDNLGSYICQVYFGRMSIWLWTVTGRTIGQYDSQDVCKKSAPSDNQL
jgi:hypothetical protein